MEKTSACFSLRDSEVIFSQRWIAKYRLRRKTVNIEQNFAEIVLRELQIQQTIRTAITHLSRINIGFSKKVSHRGTAAVIEYKTRSESPEHNQLVNYILHLCTVFVALK